MNDRDQGGAPPAVFSVKTEETNRQPVVVFGKTTEASPGSSIAPKFERFCLEVTVIGALEFGTAVAEVSSPSSLGWELEPVF